MESAQDGNSGSRTTALICTGRGGGGASNREGRAIPFGWGYWGLVAGVRRVGVKWGILVWDQGVGDDWVTGNGAFGAEAAPCPGL